MSACCGRITHDRGSSRNRSTTATISNCASSPMRRSRQAVLVAKLDNLGKGASGAAVQNLRLMLGLDE